jgi:hypothetical protein
MPQDSVVWSSTVGHGRLPVSIVVAVSLLFLTSCTAATLPSSFSQATIAAPPHAVPQEPNVASLDPQSWYIYYSSGMPSHPSLDSEGAWSLSIPSVSGGGHVNYVQTPFMSTSLPHTLNITFRVESEGPAYDVIDPSDVLPATVHVFFERNGDNLVEPDGRWWAHPSMYNLGSQDGQTITYTIPFTYDQWSNVNGEQDEARFAAAWQNVGWVGVTFGGQYFWGHGVAMLSGQAKYVLINLNVN